MPAAGWWTGPTQLACSPTTQLASPLLTPWPLVPWATLLVLASSWVSGQPAVCKHPCTAGGASQHIISNSMKQQRRWWRRRWRQQQQWWWCGCASSPPSLVAPFVSHRVLKVANCCWHREHLFPHAAAALNV